VDAPGAVTVPTGPPGTLATAIGGRVGGPVADGTASSKVTDRVTANGTAVTVGGTTHHDLTMVAA